MLLLGNFTGMNKTAVFFFLLFTAVCCGCEKNIDFNLKNAPDVLVVDAVIENGRAPVITLTRSLNFFNSISPALLANTFIHDADVVISNGTLNHKCKEYAVPLGAGITVFYYSIDSANLADAFTGEFNKTYTLNIRSQGKSYTSFTTIPALTKKPDSIWWKKAPFQEDTNRVIMMARITDPPLLGNYVRYFTRTNQGRFLPGDNSVFDDQVIDGTTYELRIDPGVDRNDRIAYDSNYFKRGDTITLKLCNIDRPSFLFWSTWEYASQSIGNPFSQPGKVLGNISNGGLGAFYGYAADYRTLIVPK